MCHNRRKAPQLLFQQGVAIIPFEFYLLYMLATASVIVVSDLFGSIDEHTCCLQVSAVSHTTQNPQRDYHREEQQHHLDQFQRTVALLHLLSVLLPILPISQNVYHQSLFDNAFGIFFDVPEVPIISVVQHSGELVYSSLNLLPGQFTSMVGLCCVCSAE